VEIDPGKLEQVAASLDQKFGLEVLWLYGSAAKGTDRQDSDLDLGALFTKRPSGYELYKTAIELGDLLGRQVDLVDLDRAGPILGMQVLRYGRLLVDASPRRRHGFFARTVGLYEDLMIQCRPAEKAMFERMSHGRP
jgi:predicted nucleotidyltransferase